MALLTIHSTNPKLSYLLAKNPASGVLAKELRRGTIYGWFPPGRDNTYALWFRDADDGVSYSEVGQEDSFEYLDRSRYNSPLFPANAVSEVLATALKKSQEDDVPGFRHEVVVNLFYTPTKKYFDIFQQHLPDYVLTVEDVAPYNYKVTVATERTLRELLNYLCVLSLFNALKANLPVRADDDLAKKYLACVNAIDAPYLVRYAFKANLLRSRALFERLRPDLEATTRHKLALTFGSTQDAREDFVLPPLDRSPILDVGCGEGSWARILASKIDGPYVGVDPDENALEDARNLAQRKMLDNAHFYPTLEAAIAEHPEFRSQSTNVLMVEVLEHVPKDDAAALLRRIFEGVNVKKLVATTPNGAFRGFGHDEGEMRRRDHVFEFQSLGEAEQFFAQATPATHVAKLYPIGDLVDGESMGFGVFMARKGEST